MKNLACVTLLLSVAAMFPLIVVVSWGDTQYLPLFILDVIIIAVYMSILWKDE